MFSIWAAVDTSSPVSAIRPAQFFAPVSHMPRPLKVSDSRKKRPRAPLEGPVEQLIAHVLRGDPAYARKVANVRRHQERLRGRVSVASWRLYLQLEEAEMGRWTHALDRIATWALAQRRKVRKS